ncbi:MAG: pyridoxamine 5'-phosphate oxidase [Candidatus Gastranaerophilales bacterium]|nr:pyridoxamine 5'-phosphate oxidase [Candidatus Gastranaerophilales bacterium]
MEKTLVVYASKYGSAENAARMMGPILGPAQVVRVDAFTEKHREFDFVVLIAPIYAGKLYMEMETFIGENESWLAEKPLVLVCVALDEKDGLRALNEWQQRFGEAVQRCAWLGGRLDLGLLDQEDRTSLEAFARMTGYQLQSKDAFDPEKVIDLALQIKEIIDHGQIDMPQAEIRQAVEKFLQAHNTCTLCTSRPGHVRGTPIEYFYKDACLYMFSEGGEKFANLLLNPKASVSVYDPYEGFDKLAGLQITGEAELIKDDHPDYEQIFVSKGFSVEKFSCLPVQMNVIRIRIEKAEFLWSGFSKRGYAVRQSCIF